MHKNKIKKITREAIKNFKGKFLKRDLRLEVVKVLIKKGYNDLQTNNACFEQVYNELKAQNKFYYLEKGKKEKLYIH